MNSTVEALLLDAELARRAHGRHRFDRFCSRAYYRPAFFGLVLLLVGCASSAQTPATGGPPPPAPMVVDTALERRAIEATRLTAPLQVTFAWALQDRDARFNGEGATRSEPPYRARLDLFGPRGEGYLSAALVDFELRLPPGASGNVLPPPAMLWSVLGVFRAPQGAQLTGARGNESKTELQYRAGNQSWSFTLENGRLRRAEWQGPEQGRQTVEISQYGSNGIPARVVYRDWRAFRELTLTLNQVYEAASFPPDTWQPGVR